MAPTLRRNIFVKPVLTISFLLLLMSLPGETSHLLDLLRPTVSAATTFTVNSTGDGVDSNPGDGVCNDGSGACTLRAGIQEANILPSDDEITFAATLNGSVITLNNALPDISGNLKITGPGASLLTVQRSTAGGTPDFRILKINSGTAVILSGLTISNGRVSGTNPPVPGGGISNAGTLTVNDSTVSDNSASGVGGGIENIGTLTLNNSIISGNTGGGISNNLFGGTPTATINSSVISGNTVNGGIYNNALNATATLTINNSTISGNSSSGLGGGVYNFSGSFTSRATATINNSTISGNIAGGGGGGIGTGAFFGNAATTLTINNSTISGNSDTSAFGGGGIYHITNGSGSTATLTIVNGTITGNNAGSSGNGGGILIADPPSTVNTLTLRSTIVGGNFRSAGTIASDISGTIDPASSYNLIGDNTGMTGVSNGSNGNQVGTSLAPIDPRLGPLASNGGSTFTHALLVGSPAIDAGNSGLTTDQRGQPRPIDDQTVVNAAGGNASDIGVYEAHNLEVNSTADTDDGLCRALGTGNGCTLREAINAANSETGAELITFAPALTSGGPVTISLLTTLPDLSSDMNIYGPGSNSMTVERSHVAGTPAFRIFTIGSGKVVTISGLTISNGNALGGSLPTGYGGGIYNDGALTLTSVAVTGNTASGNGPGGAGGIFNNAEMTLTDCSVSGNTSSGGEAAGLSNDGTMTVTNSTVNNNSTSGVAGGIENSGTLTMTNSAISGNSAFAAGGIFNFGHLTLSNSVISGNSTINTGDGAGIINNAQATLVNSTVSGNHSSGSGGGIFNNPVPLSFLNLINCTVSGNSANASSNGGGGGIYNPGTINIRNTIVANNTINNGTGPDVNGTFNSQGHNLIGDRFGSNGFGAVGDQLGTSLSPLDPHLGPLTSNGGPTQTHALLAGSTALDGGDNCVSDNSCTPSNGFSLTTDQRGAGFERIVDGPDADTTATVDIGAYEAQVSISEIGDQSINEDGSLSLPFNVGGGTNITSVTASSSNTALVPNSPANISISGTGSSRTLQINPDANAFGTSTITVTVNGSNSQSMTDTFVLTVNPVGGFLKFSAADYNTNESSGFTTITVKRTGDLSQAVTVNYGTSADTGIPCSTANGIASPKCDFTSALGTLSFAVGEDTKTFTVLISQDSYVEGPETLTLALSDQTGGSALSTPSTATLTINDDVSEPATNPIDDAQNFVRQHYHDFLNREPDPDGLAFWTNQITECQQPGATCNAEVRRINVSAAFFLSIEFQETGYLVERLYKASYGDAVGTSTIGGSHQLPVPVIRFHEFLPDTQQIGQGLVVGQTGWEQVLEDNKVAFILQFVQRARFTTAFPTSLTPAQFVDALFTNTGVTPSNSERMAAIAEFGGAVTSGDTAARARALRLVAENSTLNQAERNKAFVLMQYFGYLRRNPNDPQDTDYSGYDFWLTKLNEFNGNFVNAEMVKAFIVSAEYRHRFGP